VHFVISPTNIHGRPARLGAVFRCQEAGPSRTRSSLSSEPEGKRREQIGHGLIAAESGRDVGLTVIRSTPSNLRAAARALSKLRKQDRLDELGEALGVLLRTSAALVDDATGPGSDMAGYARAQVIRVHAGILELLARLVGIEPESDLFASFLAQLSVPGPGAGASDDPSRFG
jgi:hypothetical protein